MTCQDFKSSKEKAASVDLWIFQLKWKQKRSSDFMKKKIQLKWKREFSSDNLSRFWMKWKEEHFPDEL